MKVPEPRPGLVVAYSYLWAVEARRGQDEGRKDRPCVIILSVQRQGGKTLVTVAPITHTAPDNPRSGVRLPASTKVRLGLDDQPSWIVTDDLNQFSWPGHDLRPIRRGSSRCDYGLLPAAILIEVRQRIVALAKTGKLGLTARD